MAVRRETGVRAQRQARPALRDSSGRSPLAAGGIPPDAFRTQKRPRSISGGGVDRLARPGGFEPPAKSLEGSCSVHLSYGRVVKLDI